MESLFSPRSRAERLIAAGRVVLTATSLVALWRDPSEPAKYAGTAYLLLAAYLAFSLVFMLVVWRATTTPRSYGLVTHALDLAFFSAFMYFTSGPASPFFAYFVFALVGATLRWHWRGTLWTALVSLAAYAALGWYFARVIDDPTFEPHKFVIRGGYMAVVAFLLGYLGRHEQRTRNEMSLLAAWPSRPAGSVEELERRLLAHAARIHGAGTTALAWVKSGADSEPARFALWRAGEVTARELETGLGALVAPELGQASILARAEASRPEALVRLQGELRRWRGQSFTGHARELAGGDPALSATWHGELASGRFFVFGMRGATSDDLLLAEVVAALAGAQLDGQLLLERRDEQAAVEERIRLARDLHDGLLQSLTGIGLRLAAARRQLGESPEEARRGLEELQRLVAVEQRDLRFFIQDLEPPPAGRREFDLAARLAELVQRIEQEWQLSIDFDAAGLDDDLPDQAERDLYFIVREALVNAVRHGEARRVRVRLVRSDPERIELEVEDDGRGFGFRGRFELGQLAAQRMGPRSLRERIAACGGTLVLDSSDRGARLEIGIPV